MRERDTAKRLERRVDLLSAVAGVQLPETLERVAMVGFAGVDELGVNRVIAKQFTGVDFAALSAPNRAALDAGLDRLQAALLASGGGMARDLGPRLAAMRARLGELRVSSDQRRATVADQIAAFRQLSDLFDEIVVTEAEGMRATERGDGDLERLAQTVRFAVAIASTAATEAHVGFDRAVGLTRPQDPDLRSAADRHRQALVTLLGYATTTDGEPIGDLLGSPAYRTWSTAVDAAAAELPVLNAPAASFPAASVRVIARTLAAHLDYFYVLEAAVGDVMNNQAAVAHKAAADSSRAAIWSFMLIPLTSMFALGGALLVRRRVLGPLRRLARTASSISAGELPPGTLPVSGPAEVRATTRVFNDLVGSFGLITGAVGSLASGDVEQRADADAVRGPLGAGLRASMDRLDDVTGKLRQSDALAAAIVDTAADAIWSVDADGVIISANDAATGLLGVPASVQIGRHLAGFVDLRADQAVARRADGAEVPVLVSATRGPIGDTGMSAVFARDITERRRLELELAHQATHDALTGLPNRTAVLAQMAAWLTDNDAGDHDALGVLFVDLDGFKAVNDAHGHAVGDAVLRVVADRLSIHAGPAAMVARLGGDEFLVAVHRPRHDRDCRDFGEQVIAELERPIVTHESSFSLSASIGIARSQPLDADPLELIRRADEAAHLAKRRGRARVEVYTPAMQTAIEQESAMQLELRRAVREGQLELHLQPILDLRAGGFPSAEALVRWRRDGELVPAAGFIPIAERSSLIDEISRWMIVESCRILARWNDHPQLQGRRIAVNVSSRHLVDDRFVTELDEVVAEHGVAMSQIELELTETRLLQDIGRASGVMQRLRDRGVVVAVDDFGTGYASMTYLRELNVDVVKLDRTFIRGVASDPVDQAIVVALLSLSDALGIEVTAEGVESGEQMAFLASQGCGRAQGHHIAQPMAVQECEAWLLAHLHPDPVRQ